MTSVSGSSAANRLFIVSAPLLSDTAAAAIDRAIRASVDLQRVTSLDEPHPVTIIVAHPVSALGALLQAGVPPEQALTRWTNAARSVILDLNVAQDGARLKVIPRQNGGVFSMSQSCAATLSIPDDGVPSWMAVAASALIAADDDARSVADHLMRLDQSSASGTTALSDMLAQVSALQEAFLSPETKVPVGQSSQRQANIAATLNSLNQIQAMVEEQLEDITRLNETEASVRHELSIIKVQVSDYDLVCSQVSTLRLAIREIYDTQHLREAILGTQLIDDGTRLCKLYDKVQNYEALNKTLQEENVQLVAELDRVYGSQSWKVTAPLRGLRRKVPPREAE